MLKNMNLKWKLSLIVSFIVLIVMLSVSIVTYQYSKNMIENKINEKIDVIQKYEGDNINEVFNNINKRLQGFTQSKEVQSFSNYVVEFLLNDPENLKPLYDYQYALVNMGNTLTNNMSVVESSLFAYITDPNGLVIADSRLKSIEDIKKYVGIRLKKDRYKLINSRNVHIINNKPIILFQKEIYGSKKGELLGALDRNNLPILP